MMISRNGFRSGAPYVHGSSARSPRGFQVLGGTMTARGQTAVGCAPLHTVWFKRDLRTHDHAALAEAAACGPVLPIFIAEPDLWAQPDMSGRHWAFVAECLSELRRDLAALGQPLIVRVGDAVDVFDGIRQRHGIATLWSHQETGNAWTYARDRRVAAWAKGHGIPWREPRQCGVTRRLASRGGWARRWDAHMGEPVITAPRALAPLADVEPDGVPGPADLGLATDPCPQRQTGGRTRGRETLTSFLTERGQPYRRAMSSPALGAAHCSRLSPHLAWGTLSMREVTQATWLRQREAKAAGVRDGWRGSLSSFQGRLHWRGHFMQKLEDEPAIEFRNFHRGYDGLRPRAPDATRINAWRAGETGLPFVDACMRALQATGWMNFRMRAMLTAVASYHLWLDWRTPGEHLARLFTDYEPGIHWSQMQMQSGTTGINTVRIYNPVKQGYDQDPTGAFVRRWVPELQDVPDAFLHEPWTWDEAGRVLGGRYPWPIINHLAAAKDARQKVWAVRRGAAFRAEADAIQDKHGSRKSGVRSPRRRQSAKADPPQLALPLNEAGDAE